MEPTHVQLRALNEPHESSLLAPGRSKGIRRLPGRRLAGRRNPIYVIVISTESGVAAVCGPFKHEADAADAAQSVVSAPGLTATIYPLTGVRRVENP